MTIIVLLIVLALIYEKYTISVLLIVALLLFEEFTKQEYIIQPFEVPDQLEKNGFTGQVIVHQILDKIYEIKRKALTEKELEQFGSKESESVPEIIVPGAEISIKPILRYFKEKFSPYKPIVITGEIIMENKSIYLTTRIMGKPPNTFGPVKIDNFMVDNDSDNIKNLEYLIHQAAIHIYRYTQPFILASYYKSVNKRDSALEIVKEIVKDKKNPNREWAYNLWGLMLEDQKNYDEAINKYNLALKEDPKFAIAHYNLGIIYDDERDYSKAKESYKKAIELDPKKFNAYNNLGFTYENEGNYSKAKEYYQKVVELDPTDSIYQNNLDRILNKLKDEEKID
ncbi:MAG: tetratricopeptide repeat protein [Candidatus Dadabacteria bacterium]|nr:tetratricopeptide repeat protein [Candidatus Dadabacteria bacterium]